MYIKTIIKKDVDKHFIKNVRIETSSANQDIDLFFGEIDQDGQELLKNVLSIKDALQLAYEAGKCGEHFETNIIEE